MGLQLALDTEVATIDKERGRYRAHLAERWETWGPNGGYLASVALRAAGATTTLSHPATLSCLFLAAGRLDAVDVTVTRLRSSTRSEAMHVEVRQDDRALLVGHVWAVDGELAGFEHEVATAPAVMPPVDGTWPAQGFRNEFWRRNFEIRTATASDLAASGPSDIHWMRFLGDAALVRDPWVDACRAVVLVDTTQWPAANRHHQGGDGEVAFVAPNIDLDVRFHRAAPSNEWLLVEAASPVAERGLIAGLVRVWATDGRLVASGSSHMLCRQVPVGTPGSGTQ